MEPRGSFLNKPIITSLLLSVTALVLVAVLAPPGAPLNFMQWSVLGIGFSACTALIAFAQATKTPHTWKPRAIDREVSNLADSFNYLLKILHEEFDSQISHTQSELNQLHALLDDAILKLVISFTNLETAMRRQHALALKLASLKMEDDPLPIKTISGGVTRINEPDVTVALGRGISKDSNHFLHSDINAEGLLSTFQKNDLSTFPDAEALVRMTEEIEQDVHTAITTLQFQDLASQLVSHAQKRMEILLSIIAGVSNIDLSNPHKGDALARLRSAVQEMTALIEKSKHNPVKQVNVEAGAVELF